MRPPVAVVAGLGAALVAGVVVALVPAALLASWVTASGIGELIPAAQPPLGTTARALLALAAAGLAGAIVWSLAVLLLPTRRAAPTGLKLKRADAHPDAPARFPIRAAEELGEPLPPPTPARPLPVLEMVPPQPLPRNLDTPLAALDPAAIPDVPRPPVRAVPPLAVRSPLPGAVDRLETFALTPAVRPVTPTPIASLLDRLERAPRPIAPAPDRIAETLGQLRRLAAG